MAPGTPQQFASSRSPALLICSSLICSVLLLPRSNSNNGSASGSTKKRSSQSSSCSPSSRKEKLAGEAMADLNAAPQFALCVALGISYILKPLLEFLDGVNKPLSPVLEFAVAVLILTLPLAYLMGILLLQLQVAPGAPAVPPAPGAARRLACFACTIVSAVLAVVAVALIAFWFLTGGSPP